MDLLLAIFDVIGTIAFAISGAVCAIRHRMDLFGVLFLAVITATGGGMLRDLIMGNIPPVMFRNPIYVFLATLTGLAVFLFTLFSRRADPSRLHRAGRVFEPFLFWSDTLGLAAFTVDGAMLGIASSHGDNLFFDTTLAFLTGVGGGLLRDLLCAQKPDIFTKHVYALASIIGGLAASLVIDLAGAKNTGMVTGFLLVILIRFLARHFRWNLPRISPSESDSSASS